MFILLIAAIASLWITILLWVGIRETYSPCNFSYATQFSKPFEFFLRKVHNIPDLKSINNISITWII